MVGRCQFVFEEPLAVPRPTSDSPDAAAAFHPGGPVSAAAPRVPEETMPPTSRRSRIKPRRLLAAPVILLALCALLFPITIWLLLTSSSVAPEKVSDGKSDEVAARRQDEVAALERQLAELTRHGEEYRRALNEESLRKMTELSKHIAELKAALVEAREQNESAAPSPSTTVIVIPAAGEVGEEGLELSSGPSSRTSPEASGSSRTVVVPAPAGPVKRSQGELNALVARLTRRIDDYATHTVFPESLEPELTQLSSSMGKPAVEGVLAVYGHARQLLKETDGMIEHNRRRKEALLRKAAAKKAASPDDEYAEKEKMKPAYPKRVGPQVETDQRLLELSEKAMEIESRHRLSILLLRNAVLGSMRRLTDPEAAIEWCERLVEDTDEDLALAMVLALEEAKLQESIPALYRRISAAKDPELKAALRRALTALAGVDLGEAAAPWAEWWAKRRSEK
jgi:hypothetical protein